MKKKLMLCLAIQQLPDQKIPIQQIAKKLFQIDGYSSCVAKGALFLYFGLTDFLNNINKNANNLLKLFA